MGRKIVLDAESFKALSSETRVRLLKHLDESRLTLSDLAKKMALAKATISSHLESLENAGLIRRADEGRKWIYYSLTRKGKAILHPEASKVHVVLALSLTSLVAGMVSLALWVMALAYQETYGWSQGGFDGGTSYALYLGIGALAACLILLLALVLIVRRSPRSSMDLL